MVLALCPACDQDIPSKVSLCPHCGLQLTEVNKKSIIESRRRTLRDRIYHYKMLSYLALSILLGAFGWFLFESDNLQVQPPNDGPYIVFAIGAVIYLIIRVLLLKFKFAMRKLYNR